MSTLGNKAIMAKNIRYYMNKTNKSRKEICDALGVKYTTFTDWIKGNTYPRIDKIELMANYFGISKADLVEERNPSHTEDEDKLITTYRELSDTNKQKTVTYAETLRSTQQMEDDLLLNAAHESSRPFTPEERQEDEDMLE